MSAILEVTTIQSTLEVTVDGTVHELVVQIPATVELLEVGNSGAVSSVNGQTGAVILNTSHISESGNLYHTAARVLGTLLTGLSTATNAVITAGDSVLVALGKLQAQITALATANTGDETTASIKSKLGITTLSGVNTGDQNLAPYALIANGFPILASATVSTNIDTKQPLYTVPAGKKCIVYGAVVRGASADLSAMGDDTNVGFNEFSFGVLTLGATSFALLTDSTKAIGYSPLALGEASTVGNAGEVLGIMFLDTSISATVVVDVLGYLINA